MLAYLCLLIVNRACHLQAATARKRVKARQPRHHSAPNQGRQAGMVSRTMQHPPVVQLQAVYRNQTSGNDSRSPNCSSSPWNLSSADSNTFLASEDLYLRRLQAAAAAWCSASHFGNTHHALPDAIVPVSKIASSGSPSGMNQVSSMITPARQPHNHVSAPASHQQWQPNAKPTSQYLNTLSPTLYPEAPQATAAPDLSSHAAAAAAAAARRWSHPTLHRDVTMGIERGQVSEGTMGHSTPPAPHDLQAIQTWHQSDADKAMTAEVSVRQPSVPAEQWTESWHHTNRGRMTHVAHDEGGLASVNLTDMCLPPPPPPPLVASVKSSKAKASWWAALKGEAHPFDLG